MSSNKRYEFTADNIDKFLKEIGKEYRKKVGKNSPAELILVGGASILINYGFRNMTTDIDSIIFADSIMKEIINSIGDRYGLPNGWLNADFIYTKSYTSKIIEFSCYYKTYSNILSIRTISAEYLIAMKLKSGRQYKSDLSDILGILEEHRKKGKLIDMQQIYKAVVDLYGDWDEIPETSKSFIENVMDDGNFEEMYNQIIQGEKQTKELLIEFNQQYPNILTNKNVNNVLENIQKTPNKATILSLLRRKKKI